METFDDLMDAFVGWMQDNAADGRLVNETRQWVLEALEFDQDLTQEQLRKFIDFTKIDDEIIKRLKELDNSKRKQVVTKVMEMTQMFAFRKCLVERHKTRLQYYRDDMSNKGVRLPICLGVASAGLASMKDNLET